MLAEIPNDSIINTALAQVTEIDLASWRSTIFISTQRLGIFIHIRSAMRKEAPSLVGVSIYTFFSNVSQAFNDPTTAKQITGVTA